ncbi:YceI family protein [Pontibacter russatus]|uniref:YceI family protein n=1 Tax=Pontibacter russatus TaxID=2694929 RepID=UPI001379C85F|nr:YceI family protein [Pontibacter russatus]
MYRTRRYPLFRLLPGLLLLMATACDTTVKTDEAVIAEAVQKKEEPEPTHILMVDTAQSEVTWIGARMTGRHNGVFPIRNGELYMSGELLTGGNFVLDVARTASADKTIDRESNQKLTTHLRSADFFDVEKYPTAQFELVGIARLDSTGDKERTAEAREEPALGDELRIKDPTHRITGNLTIKGKTKSVSFPARVTIDSLLRAKANFNIDRTHWGLVYRSDRSLGDKTIYPAVNIGIDLVARPEEK